MTAIRKKLVIVGDIACGKKCLLLVFSKSKFPELYVPIVFLPTVADIEVNGKTVQLELTDVKGQENYKKLLQWSFSETDVVLLCFSIDNPESLESIAERWTREVRQFCPDVPIILVGNKKDLRNDENIKRELANMKQKLVKYEEGAAVCKEINGYAYVECSAKTKEGVREVFETAAKAALETQNREEETKKNRENKRCLIS